MGGRRDDGCCRRPGTAQRRSVLRWHRPAQHGRRPGPAHPRPGGRAHLRFDSGAIGAKPRRLPSSIGDGELAETADTAVPVHEMFNYWLQGGRIDVGMVGVAQLDRSANINTTVIGPYGSPRVRLPGAGGAPEIVSSCRRTVVVVRHSRRGFVPGCHRRTSERSNRLGPCGVARPAAHGCTLGAGTAGPAPAAGNPAGWRVTRSWPGPQKGPVWPGGSVGCRR